MSTMETEKDPKWLEGGTAALVASQTSHVVGIYENWAAAEIAEILSIGKTDTIGPNSLHPIQI